jgi:hypothetical protein
MSTTAATRTGRPSRGPLTDLLTGGGRARRLLWLLVGLWVLFSLVRVLSGEQELTSSSTLSAALLLAVPIGLAALGGLWSERAGVVNIGLEGMMILGTWGAGWAGYQWGWVGAVIGGMVFGAAGWTGPRRAAASRRSPSATTWACSPTRSSRTSASATGSAWRSPRCSTATPAS